MTCSPDDFRAAMRRFPSGVAIVAAGSAPRRAGMTATAVCSLSADPPQVLACLNRASSTSRAVEEARFFSINLLATSQLALARVFAGLEAGVSADQKFAAGVWCEGDTGAPILTDAVLTFECALVAAHPASTHNIVIGEVMRITGEIAEDALIYRSGAFGRWTGLTATQPHLS
jgi:flavin reductase (DIM6/NTAB) family NADH-FMN oxidoreductase RutF